MNSTKTINMCPRGETSAVTQAEKDEHKVQLHSQVPETSAIRQKRRPPPVKFPLDPGVRNYVIVRKSLEEREPSVASLDRLNRPSITFSNRKNFQLSDDKSESHSSPRPSPPSPTTKKGSTTRLPPLVSPWAGAVEFLTSAGQLETQVDDQLTQIATEPIAESCNGCDVDALARGDVFTIAAIEFSKGLDVNALINPEYVLEDHDELRGLPDVFRLEPHSMTKGCGCHFCMMWANGTIWDLEEHQGNVWCDCMKCSKWNEDERRRQLKKQEEKRAEMYRQRLRDAGRKLPGGAEKKKHQAGKRRADDSILDTIAESEIEAGLHIGCFPGWIFGIVRSILRG